MNKFDEKYDIRFATYEEIDEIMSFIDNYWKKGHILATNREFFEYEHYIDGHVTFLIAKNHETSEIDGLIGFLPASDDVERLDVWGVVWKVKDDVMPMLGIELKKRLAYYTKARTELGVGANPKTSIPLLKILLRYAVGKMDHYYMVAQKETYKIAQIHELPKEQKSSEKKTETVLYDTMEDLEAAFDFNHDSVQKSIPYKNAWYVERRYFNHPIYRYNVYGLYEDGQAKALLVTRKQEYDGSSVIRIVDYIGEHRLFSGLQGFFKEQLENNEYVDFYCAGFEGEYIEAAGFIKRNENDSNIIPNYFSPYECRNIDIYVDSSKEGCVFFKADGDQDRPN